MRNSYRGSDGWWSIKSPKGESNLSPRWFAVLLSAIALALAVVGSSFARLMPAMFATSAQGTWEPASRAALVASEDGTVTAHSLTDGDFAKSGDLIATLDLPEVSEQMRNVEHLRKEHILAARDQHTRRQLDEDDAAAKLERLANEHATLRSSLRARTIEFLGASEADAAIDTFELGKHSSLDPIVRDLKSVERETELTRNRLAVIKESKYQTDLILDKVAIAKDRMASLRKRFDAKDVRAKSAGEVVYRHAALSIPYLVKANDTIAELIDRRDWLVRLLLSEQALHSLREGDEVIVVVPALGNQEKRTVRGHVLKIASLPDPQSPVQVVYRVDVAFAVGTLTTAEMEQIKPGYSTQVRLRYRPKTAIARFVAESKWFW